MELSQRKEQFSKAYVRAVASVAGFSTYEPSVDDDSIDVGFSDTGSNNTPRRPRIEAQLKCSAQDILREDGVHFPLSIKNYNDLRAADFLVPRILVVVLVPEELEEWLTHTEEETAVRRCGYWRSLTGMDETQNAQSVTVVLPRTQCFTAAALQEMMGRVSDGGMP